MRLKRPLSTHCGRSWLETASDPNQTVGVTVENGTFDALIATQAGYRALDERTRVDRKP